MKKLKYIKLFESFEELKINSFDISIDKTDYDSFQLPTKINGIVNGDEFDFESNRMFNIPRRFHNINDLLQEIIYAGELNINEVEVDDDDIRDLIISKLAIDYVDELNKIIEETSNLTTRGSGGASHHQWR